MNFIEDLNERQKEAVLYNGGPSMVIAGAGSGKTRVLTYRIAYLISTGVDPFNILALTFTNKAAKEMRSRVEKLIGLEARNLWIGTFHSIFARILRIEADKLGYPSNFSIYDAGDSKSLVRLIIKEMQLDDKNYKPSVVLKRISMAKNSLVSVEEYLNSPLYREEDERYRKPELGNIYKTYQQRCFKASAMDFDDLLFNTYKLFQDFPETLHKYQNKFHYVLLDEFQDTNHAQYLITRKLASPPKSPQRGDFPTSLPKGKSAGKVPPPGKVGGAGKGDGKIPPLGGLRGAGLFVVGDDAQSIYAFRGADIHNMLSFEKDYADLKIFKLEQNYRSTKNIVEAANSVIINNKDQLPKKLWTDNDEGDLINVLKAGSDNEEGKLVANSIFEEKVRGQLKNSDFAILYRTNAQSRAMEEALRRINIKYKIVGGLSFYQRKEIKDILAYLRFTVNHNDEEALRRIINYPRRGIGDTTISKLLVLADENQRPLWEIISQPPSTSPPLTPPKGGRTGQRSSLSGGKRDGKVPPFGGDLGGAGRGASGMSERITHAIEGFATLIKSFVLINDANNAFETTEKIAKSSGLLKELYEDKTVEGLSKYENVQELLNAIKEFVDNADNVERTGERNPDAKQIGDDKSLGCFLQEISLLTDADTGNEEDADRVTLMTIHASKGLEFRNVYVVGLEEDLFPSQMMLNSRADLEEERRLFYVALTRSEKKLTLSYAEYRYRYGNLHVCKPSRFLDEIDPKYIAFSGRETLTDLIDETNVIPPNLSGQTGYSGEFTQIKALPLKRKSFARPITNTLSRTWQGGRHSFPPSGGRKGGFTNFTPDDTTNLTAGMKVEHTKFGYGIVKKIDGKQSERKAKILFDKCGKKTLLLSFAKLRIV